jgi:hypothetical protein
VSEIPLNLDSRRWHLLRTAYGPATEVPNLLRALKSLPESQGNDEPWYTIWSALAHQDDVHSASFAAVPHVIEALASDPVRADAAYFQFPAWVEICRCRKQVPIPADLEEAYFHSLRRLPALAAIAAQAEWGPDRLVCVLSAVAASKGFPAVAEAVLELTPDVSQEFIEWILGR